MVFSESIDVDLDVLVIVVEGVDMGPSISNSGDSRVALVITVS
jgi:hypothetical protein